jgi:hypothetical protein
MAALVYDPRSKGAESYIRLAKELLGRHLASGFGLQASAGAAEEVQTPATEMDKTA